MNVLWIRVRAILAGLLVAAGSAALPWVPAAAGQVPTGEPRFGWPLAPSPAVTRPFDAPAHPYAPGHRGVDLGAKPRKEVLAAGAGVVVFAGRVAGRGAVSVDHAGGLRTTYEPVTPAVVAGDQIYRGQVLGAVVAGHAGCPVAACLHWGVRRGAEYLNPLRLIQVRMTLRLKPWEGVS